MWAWTSRPPQDLAAWAALAKLAQALGGPRGLAEEARQEAAAQASEQPADRFRFERFSARLGPLFADFSKQRINARAHRALVDLAVQSGLEQAIGDLLAGAPVNHTENRAALHTELRKPDNRSTVPVREVRRRFLDLAENLRNGRHLGATGRPIETVLHIGVGGSHLGPQLATEALSSIHDGPQVRFLASVDGHGVSAALRGLSPETTLAIVVSKSFATQETRSNAEAVKSWFIERTCDPTAIARHFVAVTENVDAARAFGVAPALCLPMWEWVGGRFSLWSAVGLAVAIAVGKSAFEQLLAGANRVDEHFRKTPLEKNLPATLALLQVWNGNFLGAASHAVLPYDRRLRLLPDYLQQLEMESNGKSVRLDGQGVATHSVPVVWGGEETNGQHAFHQMLHQGTRAFSADFVACAKPAHGLRDHHDWLLAHCLAQSRAMREGNAASEAHRRVPGGHPSTSILLDELTPHSLGALLALYEHKVFCAGVIWQINSFDQWGVELGKELAESIHDALGSAAQTASQDAAEPLIGEIKRRA